VRTEEVPWARPGARHSRDLQDVVAYMAQRMDKTTITKMLRVSWEAVAKIVIDVVADSLDTGRLDGLYRIGVDEVSYRKGHRYLTVVADHDRDGAVVWAKAGRDADTLIAFYDELGEERCADLDAVSLDMGGAYKKATDARAGQARQCVDPFHLVKLANEAIDKTRRWAWNVHRDLGLAKAKWVKRTRWALLKDPESLKDSQLAVLHQLRRNRSVLYRCWQLKEGIRDLYRLAEPADAPRHLDWWLAWACRSRIPAFVTLSKTVRANRDRILAAVELSLSNSKLEGLNSKIRLINHRGYGHHSAAAVIAMIYLCCGGITIELPFK
ncbi:MAG: ISL3 family transposase, partial [Acidimicrobiales bacterium]